MLFGKRPPSSLNRQDGSVPAKGRSVLNVMFNPQIGATIRPLGQCADLFVQIIAMIFAMNGLFPKNHPVLNHSPFDNTPAPKLKLGDIFRTAWSGLQFTADGAPKVALFFAVVICMFLLIIGALIAASLAFFGTAHAATGCASGMFAPCDASNDLALGWLEFIFKNKPLGTDMTAAAPGIAGSHAWQTGFMTVLAFYSDAILVVAAFILFYHLVSMVVETAHHGVPMGKRASQIWAPIRLVVAIGLLVPISASGLNSGQYIAIQIAEWGSGLGSQVWALFVSRVVTNAVAMPPKPYVSQMAGRIVSIAACKHIYNKRLQNIGGMQGLGISDELVAAQSESFNNGTRISYENRPQDPGKTAKQICGSVMLPAQPLSTPAVGTGLSASQTIGRTLSQSVPAAFARAYAAAFAAAESAVGPALDNYFLAPNDSKAAPRQDIITPVGDIFQQTLDGALQSAMASIAAPAASMSGDWTRWGWASAGTFFNDIAAIQSVVTNVLKDSEVKVTNPAILGKFADTNGSVDRDQFNETFRVLETFNKWAGINWEEAATPVTTPPPTPGRCPGIPTPSIKASERAIQDLWAEIKKNSGGGKPIDIVFVVADFVAAKNCVWQKFDANTTNASGAFELAIKFTSSNPLAEMAQLGHNNLTVAFDLINYFIWLEMADTALAGAKAIASQFRADRKAVRFTGVVDPIASGIINLMGTIVLFLALIFFTCGILLAFFVPLIPFTKFFFNLLSWIVMVMEAVVAIPLVALAHLNPEGEGLPGASAKTAYFFIFDIFLRPVLMVFGLICGYLIFLAAAVFLNTLYAKAVVGAGGVGFGHLVFTRIFFSALYVMLLYTAANNAFSLIHSFPEHALLWIGQRSMHKEQMGDARDLGSHISLVSGYAGQQALKEVKGSIDAFQSGLRQSPSRPPLQPAPPLAAPGSSGGGAAPAAAGRGTGAGAGPAAPPAATPGAGTVRGTPTPPRRS